MIFDYASSYLLQSEMHIRLSDELEYLSELLPSSQPLACTSAHVQHSKSESTKEHKCKEISPYFLFTLMNKKYSALEENSQNHRKKQINNQP